MANFYSLVFALVAFVLSAFPSPALAAFPAKQTNTNECTVAPCEGIYLSQGPYNPSPSSSPTGACTSQVGVIAAFNASTGNTYAMNGSTSNTTTCKITRTTQTGTVYVDWHSYSITVSYPPLKPKVYSCPADATLSGASCTCNAPTVQNAAGDACEAPEVNNCPKPGIDGGFYSGGGRSGMKQVCSSDSRVPSGDPQKPGCKLEGFSPLATGGNSGPLADPEGWTWGAQMKYTGEKCLPNPAGDGAKPDPTNPKCTPPKVAGTVNGQQVCYTPTTGSPESNKPSSSNSPPKTTTSDNPDGSKNTTTTTNKTDCANGTCTTTTTHTTTNTSPTGTTSAPETKTVTTTCRMGPGCGPIAPLPNTTSTTSNTSTSPNGTTSTTSTTTGTSGTSGAGGTGSSGTGSSGSSGEGNGDPSPSQFAGQCGAAPFCDGDAVMCAVAAATFATNCALKDPGTPSPLYDSAITKTGDLTANLPGNSTVSVASTSFDQTNFLGGGSGMVDRTITVAGSSISVPFSTVNVWLARLGVILQAVTFLLCARIVARG